MESVHIHRTHIIPGNFDDDWKEHVEQHVENTVKSERDRILKPTYQPEEYNKEIAREDIYRALGRMNKDASPGPDAILPVMLIKATSAVVPHLHTMFNQCWNTGKIPSVWKKDDRIYLPKQGKPDYHIEKAYRPLSLNSVVGKTYESTATHRYVWFLHTQHQIDAYNFAYVRGSSTTHALLYLINAIRTGFQDNKSTAAAFIDLEGAFDAVWREGAIYKVAGAGIKGRLLLYIADYLSGRQSRSRVNNYVSEWTDTNIGVPQGSLIAPLLFTLYIRDISTTIPANMKYADDISGWVTHSDPTVAAHKLQQELKGLCDYLNKWRLFISEKKTEIILFTKTGHQDIAVTLNGTPLVQVTSKVLLGVDVDENLNFQNHLDLVATKTIRAITSLQDLLQDTGGVSRHIAVMLYKAYVLPNMEYAYPAWCTINSSSLDRLDRLQRISLLKATGCLNSTASNVLDVLTGCTPIRLRLKECLAQEFARIRRKRADCPIQISTTNCLSKPVVPSVITAPHLMQSAYRPTQKTMDIDRIEHEPHYSLAKHIPIAERSISTESLGSSNTRTVLQRILAKTCTDRYLTSIPSNVLPCFTDGSALRNPGPCGAAAIIYTKGMASKPVVLNRSVAARSTSYHGELSAIDLALEYVAQYLTSNSTNYSIVAIHTDCLSALETVRSPDPNNLYALNESIRCHVTTLMDNNIHVEIAWIPGHADIAPNDLADRAAKEAARAASESAHGNPPITLQDVKNTIRSETLESWRRQWAIQTEGRHTYSIFPTPCTKPPHPNPCRSIDIKLNRLRSGHTLLAEHAHKMKLVPSPVCKCGKDRGSILHFLFHCPLDATAREEMINRIELGYVKTNTPGFYRQIDVKTVLGTNGHLCSDMRNILAAAIHQFLASTKHKI